MLRDNLKCEKPAPEGWYRVVGPKERDLFVYIYQKTLQFPQLVPVALNIFMWICPLSQGHYDPLALYVFRINEQSII